MPESRVAPRFRLRSNRRHKRPSSTACRGRAVLIEHPSLSVHAPSRLSHICTTSLLDSSFPTPSYRHLYYSVCLAYITRHASISSTVVGRESPLGSTESRPYSCLCRVNFSPLVSPPALLDPRTRQTLSTFPTCIDAPLACAPESALCCSYGHRP